MGLFGTSRRVARRTARRTSRRWGMWNRTADQDMAAEQQPDSYTQPSQEESPMTILKLRLAKGEITAEQYDQSIKLLQGG
ncbi:MAG TPA: hypothetical protein VE244_00570 [Nitrososphaeraceae archaeon]|jgi:hypothetical protein|nr:hypothetical protein [Nitrososphaeraceae archaeon]